MQTRENQRDSRADPDHITNISESLVTIAVQDAKSFTTLLGTVVAQHNFTLDEWMVLDAIIRNDGAAMTQIAAASGCQGATLTRAVDKLVSAALVYREASPVDRRKVVVFMSDRGGDVHDQVHSSVATLETAARQAVMEAGLTPEKFLDLMHTLAHLEIAVPAGE